MAPEHSDICPNAIALDEESQGPVCDSNLLRIVLCLVSPRDLLRAQVVCKQWKEAARDPQVRKAAFVGHWRLSDCQGTPKRRNFFEVATLSSFATRHEVQRSDTLQMLAVRYGVDLVTMKRMNNIMTDHSLYSRTHVYIPASKASELEGRVVLIQYYPLAARDVAVLVPPGSHLHLTTRHRGRGPRVTTAAAASHMQVAHLRAKLTLLLGKSLHVDEQTAKFYLEDANGDVKAAMIAFEQDLDWESTTAGPLRVAPMQRWISGELGL